MADHDAAAAPIPVGQLTHQVDVHRVGRIADVEVDIEIDVEFAREREDAPDLPRLVSVVTRRAAEHPCAAPQAFDQQFIRAGKADQPFLREHADLDLDRPLVVCDQRLDGFEAAHADGRINLDLRAHPRRAMQDALLEGRGGPRTHILDRHERLQRRYALHRAQGAAFLRHATVDDARLVEMDVRLDQARTGERAARIMDRRVGGDRRLDRHDAPIRDADVARLVRPVEQPRIADDQVHALTVPP